MDRLSTTEKYRLEGLAHGLILLGLAHHRNYRTYKCVKCDTRRAYCTGAVRRGNIKCQGCHIKKLNEIAEPKGFVVVGNTKVKNCHHKYRCLKCGLEKVCQDGHMKHYNVVCQGCPKS